MLQPIRAPAPQVAPSLGSPARQPSGFPQSLIYLLICFLAVSTQRASPPGCPPRRPQSGAEQGLAWAGCSADICQRSTPDGET